MAKRIHIGGVPIDAVTFAEALAFIETRAAGKLPGTVFTPNVDHIVLAQHHAAFREAYARVDLSLVDGTPVLWAARLLGHPLPEKVSGSDLFEPLAGRARDRGFRVFLLGGGPGVVEKVESRLREKFAGIQIVGTASPLVDADVREPPAPQLIQQLRDAAPDLLFVAFGAPKQELFIRKLMPLIGPCVAVAVGGAFDFTAGTMQRAPPWMSRAGLEWSYRLWREPRRLWKRYLLRDPEFAAIVAKELGRRLREGVGN